MTILSINCWYMTATSNGKIVQQEGFELPITWHNHLTTIEIYHKAMFPDYPMIP
jgi:hypothetical protein